MQCYIAGRYAREFRHMCGIWAEHELLLCGAARRKLYVLGNEVRFESVLLKRDSRRTR